LINWFKSLDKFLIDRKIGNVSGIGSWLAHQAAWVSLLGVTTGFTYQFLYTYAPGHNTLFPFFGIALFEGGIFHWKIYSKFTARNAIQYVISLAMIGVSTIAVGLCTAFEFGIAIDVLGQNSSQSVLIAVIAIMLLNILSFTLCDMFGPGDIAKFTALDNMPLSHSVKVDSEGTINSGPALLDEVAVTTVPPTNGRKIFKLAKPEKQDQDQN